MTNDKATALREAAVRVMGLTRLHDTTTDLGRYYALSGPAEVFDLLAERERLRGALEAARTVMEAHGLATAEVAHQALEATDDQ